MPSKERHTAQANHNARVLGILPEDALDWRVTLMMYVCLHGIRAYISGVRPGYAGNDFRYDSFPRVLEREITPPEYDLSAAFDALVRLSYRTRYRCPDPHELARIHAQAQREYGLILTRLRDLGINISS